MSTDTMKATKVTLHTLPTRANRCVAPSPAGIATRKGAASSGPPLSPLLEQSSADAGRPARAPQQLPTKRRAGSMPAASAAQMLSSSPCQTCRVVVMPHQQQHCATKMRGKHARPSPRVASQQRTCARLAVSVRWSRPTSAGLSKSAPRRPNTRPSWCARQSSATVATARPTRVTLSGESKKQTRSTSIRGHTARMPQPAT
mmetsp:Transcript_8180/g.26341  ORF Transcript_8180/g.26341 Transcript_8180/m.26341 type:complete len:201 (+) Transcript_8180:396-998(+)